jgi:hypothetical protein
MASIVALAAALALAGCDGTPAQNPGPPSTATPTTSGPGATVGTGTVPASAEPSSGVTDARTTFDFAVPNAEVTVTNPVTPPVPPLGLPYLVGIYTGDHPEGSPKYQRISFYFRAGFPSYRFGYVSQLVQDGSGMPTTIDGDQFLSLVFVDAQAHDNAGASTVAESPAASLGMSHLVSYTPLGDVEGHVSYGLGVGATAGTGTAPAVRLGQLKRADANGNPFYVVYLDVVAG